MSRIFGKQGKRSFISPNKTMLSDSFVNDIIQQTQKSIQTKFSRFKEYEHDQFVKRSTIESYLENECGLDSQCDRIKEILDHYCLLTDEHDDLENMASGTTGSDLHIPSPNGQNNVHKPNLQGTPCTNQNLHEVDESGLKSHDPMDEGNESSFVHKPSRDSHPVPDFQYQNAIKQQEKSNSQYRNNSSMHSTDFTPFHERKMDGEYLTSRILETNDQNINLYQFTKLMTDSNIVQKAIDHELAIPQFREFVEDIIKICEESEQMKDGKVPDYIPELKNVNEDDFSVSVTTVDGQQFSYGDANVQFTLQAAVLPLVYCLALEQHGKKVKDYIGREPSGARFNDFVLTEDKKPHNSLISTGGILTCSLIDPKEPNRASERYGNVNNLLTSMSASKTISFNQRVYLSEKSHADRNSALAYYMRGQGVRGMDGSISDILDFYYQCCSIATNTKAFSEIGATLANSGVNIFTQKRVLRSSTVRQTLSVMYTCGLADSSGEWAFNVGLPAKSGISGCMLVIVPNTCGIAIYSPRVNEGGHSLRAIDFCKRLVNKFSFSIFDQLVDGITAKADPTIARVDI